jgi:protein-L-isoaspartate(D-aspartate) O-methyltransferase
MTINDEAQAHRAALVKSLKEKGELSDPRMEAAFLNVPRHEFLPDMPLDKVYADEALPVKRDPDGSVISSSSQPLMMAMMLRQLELQPGHNVLEIGAGTGYNAAIMQYMVGDEGNVTTLEIDQDLVRQAQDTLQRLSLGRIRVVHADAAGGYAPRAAYDRIIATAGVWDIPKAWVQQLKPRGIIVAPIWLDAMQVSAALRLEDDGTLYSDLNLPCGFIRLRGMSAGPVVTQRVGNSSLILTSNEVPMLDGAALHTLLSDDVERALLDIRLNSSDYFHGFMPYLVLNLPRGFTFALYQMGTNQQDYGIASGTGIVLIQTGSACFLSFDKHGEAHSFGAPDAFIAFQQCLRAWDVAGRPDWRALRLRLYPIQQPAPTITTGRLYARQDHILYAWQTLHSTRFAPPST